ncbi:MAG: hypothetical protein HFH45_01365 [Bacilli bacterium]|nr:hypothetical protein [Bacilli bacterium]
MSADEFWKQDPELFWAYRFSYIKKQEFEHKTSNYNAWLQGAYFYEALSVSLSNAFSKEKHSYRTTPFGVEETTPKQNIIETQLKNRVLKVQELFRGGKCKTN